MLSKEKSFNLNLESGYNDGFIGKIGIGFSSLEWENRPSLFDNNTNGSLLPLSGIGINLQYRLNSINELTYQGPNLQAYLYLFLFKLGVNGAYLFYNGRKELIIEPEIGLTFISIITAKFTYNITEPDLFFPDEYKKWGVLLSLDIPLEG